MLVLIFRFDFFFLEFKYVDIFLLINMKMFCFIGYKLMNKSVRYNFFSYGFFFGQLRVRY